MSIRLPQEIQDNFPYSLLGARLYRQTLQGCAWICHHTDRTTWRGRTIYTISREVIARGSYLLITLISAIEALVLKGLFRAVHCTYVLTFKRLRFLDRMACQLYSTQCYSRVLSSLALMDFKHADFQELYLTACTNAEITYLPTALQSQVLYFHLYQREAQEESQHVRNIVYMFTTYLFFICHRLIQSAQRDFPHAATLAEAHHPNVEHLLSRLSTEDREFVGHLQLFNAGVEDYRRLVVIGRRLTQQLILISSSARPVHSELLHSYTRLEELYQSHLLTLIKRTIARFKLHEDLGHLFHEKAEVVRESLETTDSDLLCAVCLVAQLGEIQGDNLCPSTFSNVSLHSLSPRHQKLEEAKKQWALLSPGDRRWMEQWLIQRERFSLPEGEHFDNPKVMKTFYQCITELAGELYQGPLLCQETVEHRLGHDDIESSSRHLLREVWTTAC